MTEADFHVRFKKLERSNRRLTAFCFSFAVVLIVALVQGQVKPPGGATPKALVVDSVRTKSVFIVDDKGEDVGFWGRLGLSHFDNDSSVSMTSHSLYQTYKDKNMWGISSKAQHPGGMVMVMNADGLPQAGLSAINYEPRLAIFDKNENLRAVLDAHTLPVPGTGKVIKYPEAAVTLLAPGDKVTWEAKPGGAPNQKRLEVDEIRTKELVIVDDHGRDRGCWNPNSIQIVGKELKRMLQMRAYSINQHQLDDGSHFSVGDQFIRHRQITALRTNWGIGSFDFRTAAEIETWKAEGRGEFIKQGTYMNLYDERGLPRVSLRAKITGSGLTVKDDFGKTKWEAP